MPVMSARSVITPVPGGSKFTDAKMPKPSKGPIELSENSTRNVPEAHATDEIVGGSPAFADTGSSSVPVLIAAA